MKIVYLKPGEMVLYESAKVPHGRQFPLEGEYYDNMLVHFHLMDRNLDEYGDVHYRHALH